MREGGGLSGFEESEELAEVDAVGAVEVARVAEAVVGIGEEGLDDEGFEPRFGGVGGG